MNAASAVVIAMTVVAVQSIELKISEHQACAQITPTRLAHMQRLWRLWKKLIQP
jgi:hypothetical protein